MDEKQWEELVADMHTCLSFGYNLNVFGFAYETYTSLLERYIEGERSQELWDEMMSVNLMKTVNERNIK